MNLISQLMEFKKKVLTFGGFGGISGASIIIKDMKDSGMVVSTTSSINCPIRPMQNMMGQVNNSRLL